MRGLKVLTLMLVAVVLTNVAAFSEEIRYRAAVGADGVQRVEILGGSYFFKPNYIVVRQNVPVELKIKKESGFVPHDIRIKAPDAGINFKVSLASDWKTIRFTPTKVGKFEFYCDKRLLWFKSHRDRGMHGTLEVVP